MVLGELLGRILRAPTAERLAYVVDLSGRTIPSFFIR